MHDAQRWPGISDLVAECHASDFMIYNERDGASAWLATELEARRLRCAWPASSLNSALRPRESGFAKIGQSWAPKFVNEDHAKTAIL